jgi:hypothetical protein
VSRKNNSARAGELYEEWKSGLENILKTDKGA